MKYTHKNSQTDRAVIYNCLRRMLHVFTLLILFTDPRSGELRGLQSRHFDDSTAWELLRCLTQLPWQLPCWSMEDGHIEVGNGTSLFRWVCVCYWEHTTPMFDGKHNHLPTKKDQPQWIHFLPLHQMLKNHGLTSLFLDTLQTNSVLSRVLYPSSSGKQISF